MPEMQDRSPKIDPDLLTEIREIFGDSTDDFSVTLQTVISTKINNEHIAKWTALQNLISLFYDRKDNEIIHDEIDAIAKEFRELHEYFKDLEIEEINRELEKIAFSIFNIKMQDIAKFSAEKERGIFEQLEENIHLDNIELVAGNFKNIVDQKIFFEALMYKLVLKDEIHTQKDFIARVDGAAALIKSIIYVKRYNDYELLKPIDSLKEELKLLGNKKIQELRKLNFPSQEQVDIDLAETIIQISKTSPSQVLQVLREAYENDNSFKVWVDTHGILPSAQKNLLKHNNTPSSVRDVINLVHKLLNVEINQLNPNYAYFARNPELIDLLRERRGFIDKFEGNPDVFLNQIWQNLKRKYFSQIPNINAEKLEFITKIMQNTELTNELHKLVKDSTITDNYIAEYINHCFERNLSRDMFQKIFNSLDMTAHIRALDNVQIEMSSADLAEISSKISDLANVQNLPSLSEEAKKIAENWIDYLQNLQKAVAFKLKSTKKVLDWEGTNTIFHNIKTFVVKREELESGRLHEINQEILKYSEIDENDESKEFVYVTQEEEPIEVQSEEERLEPHEIGLAMDPQSEVIVHTFETTKNVANDDQDEPEALKVVIAEIDGKVVDLTKDKEDFQDIDYVKIGLFMAEKILESFQDNSAKPFVIRGEDKKETEWIHKSLVFLMCDKKGNVLEPFKHHVETIKNYSNDKLQVKPNRWNKANYHDWINANLNMSESDKNEFEFVRDRLHKNIITEERKFLGYKQKFRALQESDIDNAPVSIPRNI